MRIVIFTALLIAGALVCVPRARADNQIKLRPYINVTQSFNDNIFATEQGREADFITTIAPALGLEWDRTSSTHRALYTASSEIFWLNDSETTLSHAGTWTSDFTVNPAFSLRLLERLSYSPVTSAEIFPEISAEPQPLRTRTLRSTSEVSGLFHLTERTDLTIPVRFSAYNFESQAVVPPVVTLLVQDTYEATVAPALSHRLNERDRLGLTATYSHFWFSGDLSADVIGGQGSWARNWTPRLSTTLGAGVTQAIQNASGGSSTDITGNAMLNYGFERVDLSVGYSRSVNGGAGTGATLVQDTGTAALAWRMTEDWSLGFSDSVFYSASQRLGTDVSYIGTTADAGLTYRLAPACSATLNYGFRIQEAGGTGGTSFYRNLVSLTFRVIHI